MVTNKQLKHLKKLAHHRKPVVTIGNAGLTSAVFDELDRSLDYHELLKIKISAPDKIARETITLSLCKRLKADLVVAIGHVVAIYRPTNKKDHPPRISFPG
ncbi:MAG: YhbY family RNA-binding protein [Thiohalomonadales bacterium]